jgi:hypothetical protein
VTGQGKQQACRHGGKPRWAACSPTSWWLRKDGAELFRIVVGPNGKTPPDGTLRHGVLVMVLRRQRVTSGGNVLAATSQASINAGKRGWSTRTMFTDERVTVALNQICRNFVRSHPHSLLMNGAMPVGLPIHALISFVATN